MKLHSAAGLFGLLFLSLFDCSMSAQVATSGSRTIPELPGISIESRLLPTDRMVVVERTGGMTLGHDPTPRAELETVLAISDTAIVMDVKSMRALLAPDKSWIQTELDGTVVDVLLPRRNGPIKGRTFKVTDYSGGELSIGTTLVRAGHPVKARLGLNLIFLKQNPDDGIWFPRHAPLLIEKGTLVNQYRVELGDAAVDPLHGLRFDQVAADIRRLASRPAGRNNPFVGAHVIAGLGVLPPIPVPK